ncbi:MAG: excinuclease ABC subunit UvrA [Dissulfurispiraceae bacterium]|jgi:excinuclease ABC subunit A|nr:excinuclease ABC subunit UvrA [Dissulfurispiraceae bacterium]
MSYNELIIEGARQNNLKEISLRLPHNKIIAVTGVSGSGKSSLAFDTIFAEGQWRFIESLSTYARLFIEKLDRPDADSIRNIRPSIALEQKNPVKSSRSTVGTITEIYDLLRILYSRVSTPFCPSCSRPVTRWDTSSIKSELLEKHAGERAAITFRSQALIPELMQAGFLRLWKNNEIIDISEAGAYDSTNEVVLDRLVIKDEPRLSDSIESAWREGNGNIKIILFLKNDDKSKPAINEILFSEQGSCEYCGISIPDPSPILFSFNHPVCACDKCKGFGNVLIYDEDLITPDRELSLSEGAVELWEKPGYKWWKNQMIRGLKKAGIDTKIPYKLLPKDAVDLIYKGNEKFYGINSFFEEMESKRYKLHVRVMLSRYRSPVTCPKCRGARLCDEALAYKISRLDIAEVSDLSVSKLSEWIDNIDLTLMQRTIAEEPLRQIKAKLGFLKKVGLDYLTLSRQSKTLSGGEYQRVNLSNQLSSALTGTLYVLDEPTIGLHPRDTRKISSIMRQLCDLGNTIIVVEHDKEIISSSDWIVELGPEGGHLGGNIVFNGPITDFIKADTLTAGYIRGEDQESCALTGSSRVKAADSKMITLKGAIGNNLKNIDLNIPLNAMTAVTGVSGSGKSTLIVETLYHAAARHFRTDSEHPLAFDALEGLSNIKGVKLIDQSPIGRTPRSNPLTYLKMFEPIRKLFANLPESKAHGFGPGHFSFNISGGRCEACKGEGYQKLEMYFFEDVYVMCEECGGRRFRNDILRIQYRGKSIHDVLRMTVEEAYEFFSEIPDLRSKLGLMREIGLSYLRLGQPATTISGGEAQRLKICAELSLTPKSMSCGMLYILDEPTVGLHHRDVLMLLGILNRLVDAGNTTIIIEHNLDVISQADWVIDLGPEGGETGGNLLFSGSPKDLLDNKKSYTAIYLKEHMNIKN